MFNIKNLKKSYGENIIFNGFNLSINKGQILGILGESGTGKTTLLNAIANLTDYEGEIDRVKCSYAFQKPNLFDNLTVLENLRLVKNDDTVIREIVQKLGILDKINAYPKHLSGGQAQRVSLARALIYDADLLLMDEPFSSLDVKIKITLIDSLLKELKSGEKTTVFVTHDIDEAIALADRIIILKKGEIISEIDGVDKKRNATFGSSDALRKSIINTLINK